MSAAVAGFAGAIGGIFGFLAGCIAFLITYHEYKKHLFKGRALWGPALSAGLFTFVFFLGLAYLISAVLF